MNRLEGALRRVIHDLTLEGRAFALVGGLAVSARAVPRFTRGVDLAVAVTDDADAEGVVRALLERGWAADLTAEQQATSRLALVGLVGPTAEEAVRVNLLFASSGLEPELVGAAEVLEILPDLSLPVATRAHLVALKVLAETPQRPRDRMDALLLLAEATEGELEQARQALGLIEARGFGRERDLQARLDELVASARPR
jgi:hypothetical protein